MFHQLLKEERGLLILMLLIVAYVCLALLISAYVEYHFFSHINFSEYDVIFEKFEWLSFLKN